MKYFDHFAEEQVTAPGAWIVEQTQRAEFQLIRPFISDPKISILEVGPGRGGLASIMLREGFANYVGIEPNTHMREELSRAGFRTKNYMVPPFQEANETHDWIILINVLEHLNDARDASGLMQEAYRVLKPQGYMCLAAPDYLHWQNDFFNCDYTHSNVTTVRRTMQLFHNHGFRTLRFEYLSGFLTGPLATLGSYLARTCLFFADGTGLDKKFYKLKLTFLRRFLIVGQKT